ncbi:MAG: GAP family protein [Gaiellaceae bacterium]|jgi:hypothetical protein
MSYVEILPLAIVMVTGPQIVTAFFLATSERWARCSLAYVAGAAVSITLVVSVAFLATRGARSAAGSGHRGAVMRVVDSVVLALLLFQAVHVYLRRARSEPPRWMARLQGARPRLTFLLGLVLLGLFPTDIASSIAAGLHVGHSSAAWWQCLPFVALTLLLLGAPALVIALLGERARIAMPKVRGWMISHAWIVSEAVLVLFALLTINSLAGKG